MSGEIIITPGYTFGSETDPVTTAKLNRLGAPTATIAPGAVGAAEVDAAAMLSIFASTVGQRNHFRDPLMRAGWAEGNLTVSGTNALLHNGPNWFAETATGTVVFSRENGSAISGRTDYPYAAKVTGDATATGIVKVGQCIDAATCNALRGDVTVSMWILNNTGATITPMIRLYSCGTVNNWTTMTEIASVNTQAVANTQWVRVYATFALADTAGWVNKGGMVKVSFPTGALDNGSKSIQVRAPQMELGTSMGEWLAPEAEWMPEGATYAVPTPRCVPNAGAVPGVSNDWRQGFRKGDIWVYDGANGRGQVYVCQAAQPSGAAVWKLLTTRDPEQTVILQDRKAANTAGQALTSGQSNFRNLNYLQGDLSASWCTLGTDAFTLAAGVYRIRVRAPGYKVAVHKVLLWNVTDAAYQANVTEHATLGPVYISGTSQSAAADAVQSVAEAVGVFSILASKEFKIDHLVGTTNATNGGGLPANLGGSESYTLVEVTRLNNQM